MEHTQRCTFPGQAFSSMDKAQVIVHHDGEEIISVNLIDYYRLDGELILAVTFALFLIIFARGIGVRSVLTEKKAHFTKS